MAAAKAPSPALEFLVDALKRNPKAAYADLKAKADEKKLTVYPVMFGRAKLLLGLVKAKPRGTGRFAKASAAKRDDAAPTSTSGAGRRGRQPDATSKSGRVRALLAEGMSASEIAEKVGCTTALVYNVKASMGRGGAAVVRRGPGRPRTSAAPSSADGLAGILDMVKNADRDRGRMRAALEKIQAVIADVLV